MAFRPAERRATKLRMIMWGLSGSGKTTAALELASALGGTIGVIDAEQGSSELYADTFNFRLSILDWMAKDGLSYERYIAELHCAAREGLDTVIIDTATAGWEHLREWVDTDGARQCGGNRFAAWKPGGERYREFLDACLLYPGHVIMLARAKERSKQVGKDIESIGVVPEIRENTIFDLDIGAEVRPDHSVAINNSRCREIDGRTFADGAGGELAEILAEWLAAGMPPLVDSLVAEFEAASRADDRAAFDEATTRATLARDSGALRKGTRALEVVLQARRDALAELKERGAIHDSNGKSEPAATGEADDN